MEGREDRGTEGFSLGLGEEVEDDRAGEKFDHSDMDYARFLPDSESNFQPLEGQAPAKMAKANSKGAVEGMNVFKGKNPEDSSFGRQFM